MHICVNLYPVWRTSWRDVRGKKIADHIHAISFLVKYTKTLSVRNQHDRYSLSFFRAKRANSSQPSLRIAVRWPSHTSSRRFTHALAVSNSSPKRRAENCPLQSASITTWVTFICRWRAPNRRRENSKPRFTRAPRWRYCYSLFFNSSRL